MLTNKHYIIILKLFSIVRLNCMSYTPSNIQTFKTPPWWAVMRDEGSAQLNADWVSSIPNGVKQLFKPFLISKSHFTFRVLFFYKTLFPHEGNIHIFHY